MVDTFKPLMITKQALGLELRIIINRGYIDPIKNKTMEI